MSDQYQIVKNMALLNAMEKEKLIKFHPQTGTKIHGLYDTKLFTCFYIDEAPSKFEFRGRIFGEKYFDGCFMPYLVEYTNN